MFIYTRLTQEFFKHNLQKNVYAVLLFSKLHSGTLSNSYDTIRYYSIIIINNSLAGGELVSIWAHCICCVYVVCIFVCVWFHIYYIYIYKYMYFVVILTAMWLCVFFSTFYSHELFSFNANNSEICIYIYVTEIESALHSCIPFSLTISLPLSLVIYLSLCLSLYTIFMYVYVLKYETLFGSWKHLKILQEITNKNNERKQIMKIILTKCHKMCIWPTVYGAA